MPKCSVCGKPLTVQESIERGMGPECAKLHGMEEAKANSPAWTPVQNMKGKYYLQLHSNSILSDGVRPILWRTDLRNHSPTGLSWGYHGSGPAQAALAILCDVTNDVEFSLAHYQTFKRDLVAYLDGETDHELPKSQVIKWVNEAKAKADANLFSGG